MSDQMAQMMEDFFLISWDFAKRLHEDTKKARELITELDKATNYKAVLVKSKSSQENFLEQSKSFAHAIQTWTSDYPKLLKEFQNILSTLLTSLSSSGYIIVRTFPTLSISFNEKQFIYQLQHQQNSNIADLNLTSIKTKSGAEITAKEEELAKKENNLIKEFAEIVALEYHLLLFLEKIQKSISEKKIPTVADQIRKWQGEITGIFIDTLHNIILWWAETMDLLQELRKVTYTAVELDQDAAKRIKKMSKPSVDFDNKSLKVSLGFAKIGLRIGLMICGVGLYQNVLDALETAGEARDIRKEIKAMNR